MNRRWLRAAWRCAACLLVALCLSGCWFIDCKPPEPTAKILVSEDQGLTWRSWTTLEPDEPWTGHGVWSDSKGTYYVLINLQNGHESRIYRGDAKGRKWVLEVDKDVPLRHLWGSSDGELYASGDLGCIYHRRNELDWEKIPFPTSDHINQLWGPSSHDLFVVTRNGLYHSTNGGMRWAVLIDSPEGRSESRKNSFYAIWGPSARELFVAGSPGLFLSTNDGGAHWTERLRAPSGLFQVMWGIESGAILAGDHAGYVYRSTDSGYTFTKYETPFSTRRERHERGLRAMWGESERLIVAISDVGGIARSTNGGQNWTEVYVEKNFIRNSVYGAPDGKLYVIGERESHTNPGGVWGPK